MERDPATGPALLVLEFAAADVFQGLVAVLDLVALPVGAVPVIGVPGVLLDGAGDALARADGDLSRQVCGVAGVHGASGRGVDRDVAVRVGVLEPLMPAGIGPAHGLEPVGLASGEKLACFFFRVGLSGGWVGVAVLPVPADHLEVHRHIDDVEAAVDEDHRVVAQGALRAELVLLVVVYGPAAGAAHLLLIAERFEVVVGTVDDEAPGPPRSRALWTRGQPLGLKYTG